MYVPRTNCNPSPKKSLDNQYTHVIPSVMLPRQTTLPRPPNPANSFAPVSLQPLVSSCPSFCEPRPLFSIICSLFCKNTGGGYPNTSAPALRFPRHMRLMHPEWIYGMRHVAPLSPVPSLDCAYFLSPRGCTLERLQVTSHPQRSVFPRTPNLSRRFGVS